MFRILECESNRIYAGEAVPVSSLIGGREFGLPADLHVTTAMRKLAATAGTLRLRNAVPGVMDVFAMASSDKILTFE